MSVQECHVNAVLWTVACELCFSMTCDAEDGHAERQAAIRQARRAGWYVDNDNGQAICQRCRERVAPA